MRRQPLNFHDLQHKYKNERIDHFSNLFLDLRCQNVKCIQLNPVTGTWTIRSNVLFHTASMRSRHVSLHDVRKRAYRRSAPGFVVGATLATSTLSWTKTICSSVRRWLRLQNSGRTRSTMSPTTCRTGTSTNGSTVRCCSHSTTSFKTRGMRTSTFCSVTSTICPSTRSNKLSWNYDISSFMISSPQAPCSSSVRLGANIPSSTQRAGL